MGDLSPHFSRSEFTCKGTGRPGHRAHGTPVSSALIDRLERLRAIVGRPLPIVSGYRCTWWNRQVGGASRSRHIRGDAADIPAGYATLGQAESAGFDGIGGTGRWAVHVDTRGYAARWRY